MSALPQICPVSRAEHNAAARGEFKAANRTAAFTLLANEFENAIKAPLDLNKVLVSTPAHSKPQMSVVDVMSDAFAGRDGDAALAELLAIVGAVSKGECPVHRAQAWIAAQAAMHAEFNAEDLAQGWDA